MSTKKVTCKLSIRSCIPWGELKSEAWAHFSRQLLSACVGQLAIIAAVVAVSTLSALSACMVRRENSTDPGSNYIRPDRPELRGSSEPSAETAETSSTTTSKTNNPDSAQSASIEEPREQGQEVPSVPEIFAGPISPPLLIRFPHLAPYLGDILIGGADLHVVIAGADPDSQGMQWRRLMRAVFVMVNKTDPNGTRLSTWAGVPNLPHFWLGFGPRDPKGRFNLPESPRPQNFYVERIETILDPQGNFGGISWRLVPGHEILSRGNPLQFQTEARKTPAEPKETIEVRFLVSSTTGRLFIQPIGRPFWLFREANLRNDRTVFDWRRQNTVVPQKNRNAAAVVNELPPKELLKVSGIVTDTPESIPWAFAFGDGFYSVPVGGLNELRLESLRSTNTDQDVGNGFVLSFGRRGVMGSLLLAENLGPCLNAPATNLAGFMECLGAAKSWARVRVKNDSDSAQFGWIENTKDNFFVPYWMGADAIIDVELPQGLADSLQNNEQSLRIRPNRGALSAAVRPESVPPFVPVAQASSVEQNSGNIVREKKQWQGIAVIPRTASTRQRVVVNARLNGSKAADEGASEIPPGTIAFQTIEGIALGSIQPLGDSDENTAENPPKNPPKNGIKTLGPGWFSTTSWPVEFSLPQGEYQTVIEFGAGGIPCVARIKIQNDPVRLRCTLTQKWLADGKSWREKLLKWGIDPAFAESFDTNVSASKVKYTSWNNFVASADDISMADMLKRELQTMWGGNSSSSNGVGDRAKKNAGNVPNNPEAPPAKVLSCPEDPVHWLDYATTIERSTGIKSQSKSEGESEEKSSSVRGGAPDALQLFDCPMIFAERTRQSIASKAKPQDAKAVSLWARMSDWSRRHPQFVVLPARAGLTSFSPLFKFDEPSQASRAESAAGWTNIWRGLSGEDAVISSGSGLQLKIEVPGVTPKAAKNAGQVIVNFFVPRGQTATRLVFVTDTGKMTDYALNDQKDGSATEVVIPLSTLGASADKIAPMISSLRVELWGKTRAREFWRAPEESDIMFATGRFQSVSRFTQQKKQKAEVKLEKKN